ncbi:hypothetical protein DFH94DRAFT_454047 [Russula ochroleuca]|uniref:DUF6593 domain-containing protein n=1 Tax=Russula ochroleuca TaxID=152965 RepID=A0A9P5MN39_9AGAM|nr:hypothetical protein DFH94DRAFT_454047 [Russula ochroleuca]
MAAASIYTTEVPVDEYLHRPSSPTTSISPTLVNIAHYTERPSLKLRIPSGASDILNSVVANAAGQSLYSISSNSKPTTLVSCAYNVEVATVQWDRSNPRMVFRRKKIKCKTWLSLTGPQNESRVFTHGDAQFTWTQGSTSGYLIPSNRPGLAVAQWHINPRADELILEIFQESPVESDLFEAIVLSLVLLRSGRSLGDSPENIVLTNSGNLFVPLSANFRF